MNVWWTLGTYGAVFILGWYSCHIYNEASQLHEVKKEVTATQDAQVKAEGNAGAAQAKVDKLNEEIPNVAAYIPMEKTPPCKLSSADLSVLRAAASAARSASK